MSAYLRNLERRLDLQLTEEEKDLWESFEGIMDDLAEFGTVEAFEPEPGFPDPDFDPKSASMGYEMGMESFAEELFERVLSTNRISLDTVESLILN